MTDTIAVIASAMQSDAEALRLISQNVANTQTPAYRREMALVRTSFEAVTGGVSSEASALTAPAGGIEPPFRVGSAIDLRPGTLEATGEPLSLAVEGHGFFVVSGANGEQLTRRGDFRLDAEGYLVTAAGEAVLGANGAVQISGTPVISADGSVRVADTVIDRLRMVEVPDGSMLLPVGNGAYVLADGEQALETGASQVRQGFLETSNVQSVNEMIQLIETVRHFEMAQRFVRGYDEMVENAISTLGKV